MKRAPWEHLSWLELTGFHRVTLATLENRFKWDRKRDTTREAHAASERNEDPRDLLLDQMYTTISDLNNEKDRETPVDEEAHRGGGGRQEESQGDSGGPGGLGKGHRGRGVLGHMRCGWRSNRNNIGFSNSGW